MSKFKDHAVCVVIRPATNCGWKKTEVDKEATKKLCENSNAEKNAATATKNLFKNHLSKTIEKQQSAFMEEVREMTVPWDGGGRLLPAIQVPAFKQKLNAYKEKLSLLLIDLRRQYSDYIIRERERLGDLFTAHSYYSVSYVVDNTILDASVEPLPESSKFDGMFSTEGLQVELQQDMDEKFRKRCSAIVDTLKERLLSAVGSAVRVVGGFHTGRTVRLRVPENIGRKLQEAVDGVRSLNITDDLDIERVCTDILSAVPVDAEVLRTPEGYLAFKHALENAIGMKLDASGHPIAPSIKHVQPEPAATAVPEPTPVEPEPAATVPVPEPTPVEPEPEPAVVPEPEPEPAVVPEPEPIAVPVPEPEPEPAPALAGGIPKRLNF